MHSDSPNKTRWIILASTVLLAVISTAGLWVTWPETPDISMSSVDYSTDLVSENASIPTVVEMTPVLPQWLNRAMHSPVGLTLLLLPLFFLAMLAACRIIGKRQKRKHDDVVEQQMLANAPIGLYRADSGGHLLAYNPALAAMLGVSQTIGKSCKSLVEFYADKIAARQHITQVLEQGTPLAVEAEFKHADGSTVQVIHRMYAVKEGERQLMIGYIENQDEAVKARKATEQLEVQTQDELEAAQKEIAELSRRLQSSRHRQRKLTSNIEETEAQLVDLLHSIQMGIVIIDPKDHRIVEINAAAMALLTAPREKLIGCHCKDVLCSKGDGTCIPNYDCFGVQDYRTEISGLDGEKIPVMKNVVPFMFRGRRHILETFVDLSAAERFEDERHAMEKRLLEKQRAESLGLLAGGVAHEFNNIMGGILGNLSLLDMDPTLTEDSSDCVGQIRVAARRGEKLARQMSAFSGKGRFVVQEYDLNTIVSDLYPLIAPQFKRGKNLELDLSVSPCYCEVDAGQIRQMLTNLVSNAAESIEESGEVRISTRYITPEKAPFSYDCGEDENSPGLICISVQDNGCGMSAETLTRIFDPFFSSKFSGRGLGLAAVQGIVYGHKGHIKVKSEPDDGSRFDIFLPARRAPHQAASAAPVQQPVMKSQPTPANSDPGTILVIDDEDMIRRMVQKILERAGYTVMLAGDGLEALELYNAHHKNIAAVILDLGMPHMDGQEVLARLRTINPKVQVLVVSGMDEPEQRHQLEKSGVQSFLQKPYEPASLINEIQNLA